MTCSDLFTFYAWLIHDFFMTCSWFVHHLFLTYSWHIHYLFTIYFVDKFYMTCPWLVQNLLKINHEFCRTGSWHVRDFFTTCSQLPQKLFMTCSWLVYDFQLSSWSRIGWKVCGWWCGGPTITIRTLIKQKGGLTHVEVEPILWLR